MFLNPPRIFAIFVQYLGMDNSSPNVKKVPIFYFLTESMIFTSFLKLLERHTLHRLY